MKIYHQILQDILKKIISRHGGIPSKKIKKQKIEIKIILHVYCISNSRKWEYFRVFG